MPVSEGRSARAATRTSAAFATEKPIAVVAPLPAKLLTAMFATKQAARIQGQSERDRSSNRAASRPLEGQIAATGPDSRVRAKPSQAVAA